MRMHRILVALLAIAPLMAMPALAEAQRPRLGVARGGGQYDRGYRDGFKDGERDARKGRRFDNDRAASRRGGDFQRGYSDGYRAAYQQFRGLARDGRFGGGLYGGSGRAARGGYQDPAFARGYSDGFERGQDDGRDRDRYDPVRHRDYRSADDGYFKSYGPKDAWETNYRAGFRQGYEEGYRDGNRRR